MNPTAVNQKINLNQGEFCKALEIIERDSLAIAGSFTSLFASLCFVLSEKSKEIGQRRRDLSREKERQRVCTETRRQTECSNREDEQKTKMRKMMMRISLKRMKRSLTLIWHGRC
uniref:Uncharacterized protein n=1 Tax=Salix viminalis TaxID=40686 RepID=A0A6N2MNP2_SALVM